MSLDDTGYVQDHKYWYCSRSIRYSTDLNSENNKFDMETFDLVSQYCTLGIDVELCHSPPEGGSINSMYMVLV